jgi:hypothetical protein
MNELKEFIQYFGFPIAVIVFGVWKGIPWLVNKIENISEKSDKTIRELIEAHKAEMAIKDQDIKKMVQDSLDNHKMSMEVVQANTSAIQALLSDLTYLKETNLQLKQTVEKTNDLINRVRIYSNKDAS